ncbi:MAG: RodZ domain-containing protein [Candidatus Omnitrophota bacterium]
MSTPKEIGKIFEEQREKLNLTPEDVYRMSRIHPSVIKDIEGGTFEKINKPYLKSFLKKYSDSLGLDTEKIIKQYESILTNPVVKNNDIINIEKKEPKPEPKPGPKPFARKIEKKKTPLEENTLIEKAEIKVLIIYGIVFVIVLFVFVNILRSCAPGGGVNGKSKSAITVAPVKNSEGAPSLEIKASGQVVLTLRARAEVWVQITEGEETLFAGTIAKGQSKTWRSNNILTVWTGKADMLDFFVNGQKVGVVAAGVVKHIKVSNQGVKVGETWISQLK